MEPRALTAPHLSPWRYESDGGPCAGTYTPRTHYAHRENSAAPCGTERRDFTTERQARDYVRQENRTTTNEGKT